MSDPAHKKPTLDDVLKLTKPTSVFLCPLSANVYNVQFLKFSIREMGTNRILFNVQRENNSPEKSAAIAAQLAALPPEMEASVRSVRYNFAPSFLSQKTVGATLVFSIGPQPVPEFRMVERHYFRDRLIKTFDFKFGFCIPNSTNTWEAIYDMPELSEELKRDIINHPFETRSDSFYFAGPELIMHNKAEYAYNLEEQPCDSAPRAPANGSKAAAAGDAIKK